MIRSLAATVILFGLVACGNVVMSTAAKLGMMSPLDEDPGQFAVALDLPEGAGIAPDGATLILFANLTSTGESRKETFILAQDANVYRIDPADLPRARAIQAEVRAWERADPRDATGGLTINIEPCVIGDGPAPDATVSISIQTQPGGRFDPLVRNGPLSKVANQAERANWPQCSG